MKKIVIAAIIILITTLVSHADHDEETITISPLVKEGWNLMGLSLYPRVVNDSIVSSGYDTIMLAALENRMWYYNDDGYAVADTFLIGEGYWLKMLDDAILIQEGIPSMERIHILYNGWNLVSPLEKTIHPYTLLYSHPNITSIWRWDAWNNQYKDVIFEQNYMNPGIGYWMKNVGTDTLFYDGFSADVPPSPPAKLTVQQSQDQPPDPPVTVRWKTWADVKREMKE